MVQKYIFPRTKEKKERRVGEAAGGQIPYKLPWNGERKKKIPNDLR